MDILCGSCNTRKKLKHYCFLYLDLPRTVAREWLFKKNLSEKNEPISGDCFRVFLNSTIPTHRKYKYNIGM